ncbi:MAG: repeat containing protein [Thermoleophilia bacterium]|nr:repeat containing protein [Thermoleophilia bacterium]
MRSVGEGFGGISTVRLFVTTLLITMFCAVAGANAATTAANYSSRQLTYSSGATVNTCRGWGGDSDDAGRMYMGCPVMRDTNGDGTGDVGTPALYEMDATGTVRRIGWLPNEYYYNDVYPIRDVGVSPDGSTAYVSTGPNTDNLGQHPEINPTTGAVMANGAKTGTILRLKRAADGSWAYDPSWHAGPFKIGDNYWAARYVDVDAAGRVYVSTNAYVYELSPATGAVVTSFGGATTNGPGGPWVEGFDNAAGVSVAADGRSIYVVDQQFHLVQRWLRVGATDWTRDRSFLLGKDEEGDGLCSTNDHFQSPYDVGVDAAGDVYVLDTSCQRVQRFTKAGAFVQTVWTNTGGDDLNHGFGVSRQGNILLPIEERLLVRSDPPAGADAPTTPPANCTDATAPKLTAASAAGSTATRTVVVTITATDDCAVSAARILGPVTTGSKVWGPSLRRTVTLTGWNGAKTLVAQVRDGKGRIASRVVRITLALPQPTLVARRSVAIAGRGCSAIPPMSRVAGATTYRLVDRCARIAGRVLKVQRSGSGTAVLVLVPVATARALYANAVGPVQVWAVTDARTRVTRAVRVGRAVSVVGSIVAQRNLRAAYVVPVDVLTGS